MSSDLYEKLLNASFRFVSYRPRSEKEIREFLEKKLKTWSIAGRQTFEKVMERLGELGYVDDRKFVQWWIEQRSTFRPKGKRLLGFELRQKGVAKGVLEGALGGNLGLYNEREGARRTIAKKIPVWSKLPVLERKRKVFGFLSRRGFSSTTIASVIDEFVGKSYNTSEEKNVFED